MFQNEEAISRSKNVISRKLIQLKKEAFMQEPKKTKPKTKDNPTFMIIPLKGIKRNEEMGRDGYWEKANV